MSSAVPPLRLERLEAPAVSGQPVTSAARPSKPRVPAVSSAALLGVPRRRSRDGMRSSVPSMMMSGRREEEKPPVWERLYSEAVNRDKAQKLMQDRLALEREALSSTFGRRLKSHHWDEKWRKMIKNHRTQQEERERLHKHLEYQRFLEEFRECTFQPKRFTTDSLRGPEAHHAAESLVALAHQQQQLKLMTAKCDEEEELLDEYVKISLNQSSHPSLEEARLLADSIREEALTRHSELLERRLDILHQATQLDTAHYQYLVLSGVDRDETSDFDEHFVEELRSSDWFQHGKRYYPTFKLNSAIADYLSSTREPPRDFDGIEVRVNESPRQTPRRSVQSQVDRRPKQKNSRTDIFTIPTQDTLPVVTQDRLPVVTQDRLPVVRNVVAKDHVMHEELKSISPFKLTSNVLKPGAFETQYLSPPNMRSYYN